MSNKKKFDGNYLDSLAIKVKLGSEEAIKELDQYFLPMCLKIAASMLTAYKINLDTSEPGDYLLIIHETVMKSSKIFNPEVGDYKTYFLASFVTNLYAELEKEYSDNIALFNAISLDAYAPRTNNRTYHELLPSDICDDPRRAFDINEAKEIIFADTNIEKAHEEGFFGIETKVRLQRQLILLKFYGCTIEEMAKIFGVSKYVIKRLMFDDNSYMPLNRLKKIFNKK